jgi:hypothetical protein
MLPPYMAKHRYPEDGSASVDEPTSGVRRHALIAAAVAGLTLAGATAWALSRPGDDSDDGSPRGKEPGAISSAGVVEGFGLAGPVPSGSVRPAPRASVTPLPSIPGTQPPSTREATPPSTTGGLEAIYTMMTWDGGYQVTLVVTNPTNTPVVWKVRIQLPSNALFGDSWSAQLTRDGSVFTFTPPLGGNGNPKPLAPGAMHSFGFLAVQPSGDYRLLSCAVDGVECKPANP